MSSQLMNQSVNKNWTQFSWYQKSAFAGNLALILIDKGQNWILTKMGWSKPRVYPLQQVDSNIWNVRSDCPDLPSNHMTIIKGKDNNLLLYNTVSPVPSLVEEINKIGSIAYVVVPHLTHNTWPESWKKQYPSIKVICFESDKPFLSSVPTDTTLEEEWSFLKDNFGFNQIFSLSEFVNHKENTILMQSESGKTCLLVTDALVNLSPSTAGIFGSWAGMSGLGIIRVYYYAWIHNLKGYQNAFRAFSEKHKIDILIFAHGYPLTSGVNQVLSNVKVL